MSYRGRITQASRDQRLTEMWGVEPRHVIAKKLGYKYVANVSHAAKRLGLPSLVTIPSYREGKRDISAAQKANADRRRRTNTARRRELRRGAERMTHGKRPTAATMSAKHAEQVAMCGTQEIREESPTCFVCGGRSATWNGHTQCRGPYHEGHEVKVA
jgi:hypothetical protein